MTVALLVIDGVDGSGKSRLADRLLALLAAGGTRVARIRVDDFRRGVAWDVAGLDETRAYFDAYYDFHGMNELVGVALHRGRATIPRYDSATEQVAGTVTMDFGGIDACIIEGVMSRRTPRTAHAPGIYLHIPLDESERRLYARDAQKGRSHDEIERRMHRRYFPAHHRYTRETDPTARASITVDNTAWDRPQLVRGETSAVPPVFQVPIRAWLGGVAPGDAALAW